MPSLPAGVEMPPGLFVEMPPGLFVEIDGETDDGADDGADHETDRPAILVEATELTRGPWGNGIMHGGAVCGLLGLAIETELHRTVADAERFVCSRLTVEILSGVPVTTLAVAARVVKAGRRASVVEAEFRHAAAPAPRLLARATSQWLATSSAAETDAASLPAGYFDYPPLPDDRDDPSGGDFDYPRPGFNVDAVDVRFVDNTAGQPGPGRSWIRLEHPLVAGRAATQFTTVATLCDLGAAVGWDRSLDGAAFVNTDVTLQLLREPVGEWILFDSRTDDAGVGIACCHSVISDQAGPLGWVLQSQVEAPPELGLPGDPSGPA
ncbi:MAG TPA: hypothetical protein DEP69_02180 [Acidimicrobiaceae bacterium]|nr:hypothetical protein [Acidimicrobiaceae bacterium]